jgi:hypothetical protein
VTNNGQLEPIASSRDLVIGDPMTKEMVDYNGPTEDLAKPPNLVAATVKTFPNLPDVEQFVQAIEALIL